MASLNRLVEAEDVNIWVSTLSEILCYYCIGNFWPLLELKRWENVFHSTILYILKIWRHQPKLLIHPTLTTLNLTLSDPHNAQSDQNTKVYYVYAKYLSAAIFWVNMPPRRRVIFCLNRSWIDDSFVTDIWYITYMYMPGEMSGGYIRIIFLTGSYEENKEIPNMTETGYFRL